MTEEFQVFWSLGRVTGMGGKLLKVWSVGRASGKG